MTTKRTSSTHRKKLASKDSQSYRPTYTLSGNAWNHLNVSVSASPRPKRRRNNEKRLRSPMHGIRMKYVNDGELRRLKSARPRNYPNAAGTRRAKHRNNPYLWPWMLGLFALHQRSMSSWHAMHSTYSHKAMQTRTALRQQSQVAGKCSSIKPHGSPPCSEATLDPTRSVRAPPSARSGSTSSVPVEFRNAPEMHDALRLPKRWPTGVAPLSRLQRLAGRMDDLRPVQAAQLWHHEHNYWRLREWHVPDIDEILGWEKSGGIRHGDDWTGAIEYDAIVAWRLEVLRCVLFQRPPSCPAHSAEDTTALAGQQLIWIAATISACSRPRSGSLCISDPDLLSDEAMRDYAWTWPPPTADPGWGSGTGWGDDTSIADTNVRGWGVWEPDVWGPGNGWGNWGTST
ncbi:hypothetical protein B0H13DRAFT_1889450 [Mycena leptocephala]|nr:hypothetical protein B0H13DRAFT_1889450 [Mycena leptocephala]